jgi:hypothetical protein
MLADTAGNPRSAALNITALSSIAQVFTDSVHYQNSTDFYRINFNTRSTLDLRLTSQSGDADLKLINPEGDILAGSYQGGRTIDKLTIDLSAGEYYVVVSQFSSSYVRYQLDVAAIGPLVNTLPTAPAPVIAAPVVAPPVIAAPVIAPPAPVAISQPPPIADRNPAAPVVNYKPRSGDRNIDALINVNGAYWNTNATGGVITYSFYQPGTGDYAGPEQVTAVSAAIQTNVRQILQQIATFVNVQFVEVADTASNPGMIRYMFSDGETDRRFYAYAYYPGLNSGGDVHLNSSWEADETARFAGGIASYGYTSLMHETLHALGLKHPGNYDAQGNSAGSIFLDPAQDNRANTIMSYNHVGLGAATPLAYDVQALQYLYGARSSAIADTTYRFSSPTAYQVSGLEGQTGSSTIGLKQTLWDAGGIDTLDFTALAPSQRYWIDLRDGGFVTTLTGATGGSYFDQVTGQGFTAPNAGTSLAFGSAIERVINSPGDDRIIANAQSNWFLGYGTSNSGNDVIENASANDVLDLTGNSLNDLSANTRWQRVGDDLLGGWKNGSVRVLNYFTTANLKLRLDGKYYAYSRSGEWQEIDVV